MDFHIHQLKEQVPYMFAAILLANFVGPLVLAIVLHFVAYLDAYQEATANGVGVLLGYGVSRFCRFADRRMDKELNGHRGPKHD